MELFLETVAHLDQVVIGLGVLLSAGALGLLPQLLQLAGLHLRQALLPGNDVHGQLLVVLQVELIHLVEHGDVLHEGHLVLFQLPGDLVHVDLGLGVLDLHGLHLAAGLLEEAENALLFLLLAEVLELHHQVGQGVAHLAQVLVADVGEGALREPGHALLGGGAVLKDQLGVGDVDLLGELIDHLALGLGEHTLVDLDGLGLFLLHSRRGGGGLGTQGEGRGVGLSEFAGVQGQLGHLVIRTTHCIILRFCS